MNIENFKENLGNAKSIREAYDVCVRDAGLTSSFEEFNSHILEYVPKMRQISDSELDAINGGCAFWDVFKPIVSNAKAAFTIGSIAIAPYVLCNPVVAYEAYKAYETIKEDIEKLS